MKKIKFYSSKLCVLTLSLFVAIFYSDNVAAQNERPNVIVIISDDLNDSIEGMGGHRQAKTPNINRLIEKGVQFVNAHANAAICAPSRASVWTGMYPSKTGFYGHSQQNNRWRNYPLMKDAVTLMEHFGNNDYKVYGSGKVFHNGHEDNSVFNQPMDGGPSSFGPYPWDGTSMHSWGKPIGLGHPSMPPNIRSSRWGSFGPLSDVPTIDGYTGWSKDWEQPWDFHYESETDRELMPDEITAKWVTEKLNETHEKPFFIVAGMNRPHVPRYAPVEFFDMFPVEEVELPPYLANDLEDTPTILWQNNYRSQALPNFLSDSEETEIGSEMWWKKWVQSYLASVAFVDHQVGIILDSLENSNYANNTIVIFTADHGYHMGEKDNLAKTTIWEESTRIPLVIHAPGVSEVGTKINHPVSLIDLYPTLIDLANLPLNPNKDGNGYELDGHSIKPFLENSNTENWEGPPVALNHLNGIINPPNDTPSPVNENHHSVRSVRYRYTLTSDGEEELYDHFNDPNEWHNLVKENIHDSTKAIIEWHKNEMYKLLEINDDDGSEPEPEPEDSDGIIINKNSDFQNVALGTAEDIDGWFFQKTDHADFEFIADTTDTANTLLKVTVTGIESAPNPWAIQVASSQNEIKANTEYLFKTRFYVNASNGDETAKINFSTNTVGVHKYGMTVNTGEWIELSISENPVVIEQNVIANVGLHLSHDTQINGDLIYIDYIRVIELVSNKLPTPTLSFPVDQQENVGTLTDFSWNRVDSATFYRLQLSGNSSFNSTILDTSGIESTVFTISNPLNENTKYYWRIMGIGDNEENNSDWSNEYVFTTGVRTSIENNSLPNNYILFQNYPNPFNPNTEIQYALPESNQVTLEVYNSLGQKVMELVNSYKSAGYHREIFDASNLSSGVYLYKLTTASFTKTNKMLLIK